MHQIWNQVARCWLFAAERSTLIQCENVGLRTFRWICSHVMSPILPTNFFSTVRIQCGASPHARWFVKYCIFDMFHRLLEWYCSYCAAQLVTKNFREKIKQNIVNEGTPHNVVNCYFRTNKLHKLSSSSSRMDRSPCTTMAKGWINPPPPRCPRRPTWTPCCAWSAARAASAPCCARSAPRDELYKNRSSREN